MRGIEGKTRRQAGEDVEAVKPTNTWRPMRFVMRCPDRVGPSSGPPSAVFECAQHMIQIVMNHDVPARCPF